LKLYLLSQVKDKQQAKHPISAKKTYWQSLRKKELYFPTRMYLGQNIMVVQKYVERFWQSDPGGVHNRQLV
jgi:hypothetical protein